MACWLLVAAPAGAAGRPVRPAAPVTATPAGPGELALPPVPPPLLVGEVELHLPPGTDPTGLARLVMIKRGTPLSQRAVRRTIELLWGTGRFSDVVVWQQPDGAGGLRVIVEATPRTWFDRVEFEGNAVLTTEALRKALGELERRVEYYPELVDRLAGRLQAAYQRVGHTAVKFEHALTRGTGDETVLTFTITEGVPTRISALVAAGEPQLSSDDLIATIGLSPGSVLDLEQLDRGVEALKARYRLEGYWRARVGTPEVRLGPSGAEVLLPVSAGPRLSFRFVGNRTFDDPRLLGLLGYDREEALDAVLIDQLAGRLAYFYRLMGFADVRVRAREIPSEDGTQATVAFLVEEGLPLQVVSVSFEGNEHFTQKFLWERVRESLLGAAPPRAAHESGEGVRMIAGDEAAERGAPYAIDPTRVYVEPVYGEALQRIRALYAADGYLSARAWIKNVVRDERRREARVTLAVDEGVQTLISEVEFAGAPDGRVLEGLVAVRKGKALNSLDVETSREAIQRSLGQQGYLYARVEDQEEFSADRRAAKVRFVVATGPKVRVGRIQIEGLERTNEDVVRSALPLEEGGLLDPEELAQSQRNLARLGIFRTASVRISAPEVPEEVKDVFVAVDERGTRLAEISFGGSLGDGPRVFMQYEKINLLGRALQFQAQAKFNYFNANWAQLTNACDPADPKPNCVTPEEGFDAVGRRINLGLRYPRLLSALPTELGLRGDLVHERIIRPFYAFERSAAIAGTDLVTLFGLSASLQYEIERDFSELRTTSLSVYRTRADIERLRYEGLVRLHSIRPSVTYDGRDDPIDPHKGVMVSGATEVVHSLGKGQLHYFLKTTGQANLYVPLWRDAVFGLSLKAGKIIHLEPETGSRAIAPTPKRFFMGGAGTMRGYYDDGLVAEDIRDEKRGEVRACNATLNKTGCSDAAQVVNRGDRVPSLGGELFTAARGEVHFPLAGPLRGAVFVDAGNLWFDPANFEPFRLRYTAGGGLRIITPVGPAAFDLAVNLKPDKLLNEAAIVPHFSIGLF